MSRAACKYVWLSFIFNPFRLCLLPRSRDFVNAILPHKKDDVKFPIKFSPGGNFVVTRDRILKHNREYYDHLLGFLSTENDPEIGHGFERLWGEIFALDSCEYARPPGW
jgi:hypothetical protein